MGGAKYDLVTDEIIREFFKVEPPHFLVASCTLHLNFKSSPGASDFKISALKKKIRDLEYNPERYVDELPLTKKEKNQIGELAEKKTKPLKCELDKKLKEEEERIRQSEVYTFREFPCCFFSAKTLRNLLNF